jgi:uncharacterized protein (TIGR00730 family)
VFNNKINSVTVFCGSKTGSNPLFIEHSKQLGCLLASNNIKLIYGGGNVGIMGAIANAVLENKGEVVGIIPKLLVEWEQQHNGITELIVTEDMHDRKKILYEKCDAAIILAGGYGTLDELFEMITWNNLKIHEKKVYVLNTAGFYNHIIAHIETMQQEGFLYEDWRKRIVICNEPEEIIEYIKSN